MFSRLFFVVFLPLLLGSFCLLLLLLWLKFMRFVVIIFPASAAPTKQIKNNESGSQSLEQLQQCCTMLRPKSSNRLMGPLHCSYSYSSMEGYSGADWGRRVECWRSWAKRSVLYLDSTSARARQSPKFSLCSQVHLQLLLLVKLLPLQLLLLMHWEKNSLDLRKC